MGKFDGVLLASDYDDTLYDKHGRISPENREAVDYFLREGGVFTVSTGRSLKNFTIQMELERLPVNAPVILANGAVIHDFSSGETLWKRKFWYRFVAITMYFNAGIIPWYLAMKTIGLTNNFWGYIFPTVVQPFYIILCKTYCESVPQALQDAAEIDGAGTLRIFFRIMLPVIKPILATIAIFAAVNQWNAFQDTLLLMRDKRLYTLQYVLYQYITQASSIKISSSTTTTDIAGALATAATATSIRMTVTVVVVIPVMMIYPFFQRFFTKGIMIGAVKG